MAVRFTCPMGHTIRAERPKPGDTIRCMYCGHEQTYKGAAARKVNDAPPDVTCPDCGGPVEAAFVGEKRRKIAHCPKCGKTVDPERPKAVKPKPEPKPEPAPKPPSTWSYNGKTFDDWMKMETAIRRTMQPGEAEAALKQLKETGTFSDEEPKKPRIQRFRH